MAAQLTVYLLESYLSWTMVKRSSNILVHHTRGRETMYHQRKEMRERREIDRTGGGRGI